MFFPGELSGIMRNDLKILVWCRENDIQYKWFNWPLVQKEFACKDKPVIIVIYVCEMWVIKNQWNISAGL